MPTKGEKSPSKAGKSPKTANKAPKVTKKSMTRLRAATVTEDGSKAESTSKPKFVLSPFTSRPMY